MAIQQRSGPWRVERREPSPRPGRSAMTFTLVLLVIGALFGGSVGFKLGRTYERVRPRTKLPPKKKS
jgi:hypothetical protein